MSLAGRVAVVTGGAHGIGAAICMRGNLPEEWHDRKTIAMDLSKWRRPKKGKAWLCTARPPAAWRS